MTGELSVIDSDRIVAVFIQKNYVTEFNIHVCATVIIH